MPGPLQFRQDLATQARLVQHPKAARGLSLRQYAQQLFANPLAADLVDLGGHRAYRVPGFALDCVSQFRTEPNRAEHSQLIFFESGTRIADGADQPGLDILLTMHIVDEAFFDGIVEKSIDCKIAAKNILLCICERNSTWAAAVNVGFVGTEGRHFKP